MRERVRRILELVVPGACTFHPTIEKKTKKPTPWSLVVPKQILEIPCHKSAAPYCPKCREPKLGYRNTGFDGYLAKMKTFDCSGTDIFKALQWSGGDTVEDWRETTNRHRKSSKLPPQSWAEWGVEPPPHPGRWTRTRLDRRIYFSVRLEQLFKKAKIRGQLVRAYSSKDVLTSSADETWIAEKLQLLAKHKLVDPPAAGGEKPSNAARTWFQQYLKRNAKKGAKPVDFATVEKKHKIALPKDYKDFISNVGPKSFKDVNDTEGFTAKVLAPQKMDFRDYRRGKVEHLDEEQSKIDGVVFADTEHGDCFVFDVSTKGGDYPVYWHDYEQNSLEPFAENFAGCIKRFAEKNYPPCFDASPLRFPIAAGDHSRKRDSASGLGLTHEVPCTYFHHEDRERDRPPKTVWPPPKLAGGRARS